MKITGLDKLLEGISNRQKIDEKVKSVVSRNTSEMKQKAVNYAPVDTGELQRNITEESINSGFTGIVSSNVEYAKAQEYGTRFQTGTPHIGPAFHNQKDKFINDLKNVIKE
ncbi:HK97-gp10 family putative phage morphogenesis protein [Miniphocaeibacter massiliensis]|uniref:HK97-gp10 family putative phage morphogenesis protein n=1 Tax=Miniphocaeibacter massiliensis TaxID=2041841 RepID=UPI000C1BF6F8|nr:HK97-gp10 family putative phage morphogenesis protein [Miniphocaeibacter massiliensis]